VSKRAVPDDAAASDTDVAVAREDIAAADTEIAGALEGLAAAHTEVATPSDPRRPSRLATVPPPGERIGRYAVLDVLGRGGMGVVVSAYDPELDRRVAIKLVSAAGEVARAERRERLVREARAMAKIRHPNVVAVYEVGEHEGQVYLVMEQVEGGTLRQAIDAMRAKGQADWRAVLDLFISAGRGLAAAHAAGMVHRDFKPENVFVDRDGRVLVGDFGLVGTDAGPDSTDGDAPVDERLTRADVVMGTPAYMAPEQHTGESPDGRVDQFAFCVALFEALCGELPFSGDTRKDYVTSIMRGDIRDLAATRRLPRWLREAIVRGLAPTPAARHRSIDALLVDLGADPGRQWLHGKRERAVAVAASAGFIVAWAVAMLGFDVRLTYAVHYVSNLSFLGILATVAWLGRRVFARTPFNRSILGFGLVSAFAVVGLVAGGHAMAIPPDVLGVLHPLLIGTCVATAAVTLDARLGVAAAVYFAGFLASALWPPSFFPLLVLGHATAGSTVLVVLTSRRGRP
jgi:hypothetical protein